MLIELIKEDYLSLYGMRVSYKDNVGGLYSDIHHYVGKRDESTITDFQEKPNKYGKLWWRKLSQDYFKDCEELARKIKTKEFKPVDLLAIVEYYNSNCSD